MQRNTHFTQVANRYLFQEIRERKAQFLQKEPHAKLISLSIGDTTEPVADTICQGLINGATKLATTDGYVGYGPEQGTKELREAISYAFYKGSIPAEDIFVSDGAKCDIGRLQLLFSRNVKIGLQDPAYPAYLDTSILQHGKQTIILLPCLPTNQFQIDLEKAKAVDVLFICSPNNPTGHVSTREELERLVDFARLHKKLIIFDSAYRLFIRDDALPRSIYEIDGAREVAIEIGSFSKMAGFSGVRLGWTVVPAELTYEDGHSLQQDWQRIITTFFNGASIIAQEGAKQALTSQGLKAMQNQVSFYLENTKLLKTAFSQVGFLTYGGEHAPYLWVQIPGKTSWQAFDELLYKAHLLTTPGVGFGPAGEGFLRISGFGRRDTIIDAIQRVRTVYKK